MSETCKTCEHFVPHYVLLANHYQEAGFGHCTYPKVKPRRRSTPACQHYRVKEQEKGEERDEKQE